MSLPKRPGDLPHDITLAELVQLYNAPDSTYPPSDARPNYARRFVGVFARVGVHAVGGLWDEYEGVVRIPAVEQRGEIVFHPGVGGDCGLNRTGAASTVNHQSRLRRIVIPSLRRMGS